ncbi:uncharacterized protein LOC131635918 [Vicia villosa]|uniref:uncharacterized protein LOC131635918 n=1 Tax=Vicia villosa TaxID=3911 RepID=UPI00273B1A77|nr:uncharacterized protein LOC131635918 [Vicia villosa]
MEESILRKRSKIEWVRLGDGNNSFFHSSVRSRQKHKQINRLIKEDGGVCDTHEAMEEEVLNFYKGLMGTAEKNLEGVDIAAIRKGKQLCREQRIMPSSPIKECEVEKALRSIGDLKAPGLDGYGSKFCKHSWQVVKEDVMETMRQFFEGGQMDARFNKTIVNLLRLVD